MNLRHGEEEVYATHDHILSKVTSSFFLNNSFKDEIPNANLSLVLRYFLKHATDYDQEKLQSPQAPWGRTTEY